MNENIVPAAGPETELSELIASLDLADPQVHANLTVIPLLAKPGRDGGPVYLPLAEALETAKLVITEVSHHGSVPELQAETIGDLPVLLVDGEEVSGAKQNRVLNTSVLLKEHSRTVIPVSCTESGRWRYETAHFADSGLVMAHKARANKMSSVHHSLNTGHQYLSDQAKVWSDVAALHHKTKTTSATHAMAAAFANHHLDLERCRETFKLVPGQHGLLVLFCGRVAGFDYVSRPAAYARLHDKLLKSYAIEVLVSGGGELETLKASRGAGEHQEWTGDRVLLMTNNQCLIYEFRHGFNNGFVDHLFLAHGSDGRWYYSTYHFCNSMAGARSDEPPGSIAEFASTYAACEFDGQSDVCLQHTWPEKR